MNSSIARILDANFNRAREALRVAEDYARFVLNDAAGCESIKLLRHDFVTCMRQLPGDKLLAARNTPGDVGTTLFAAAEGSRVDARDVATAATKRLVEALRTIEEYGKTVDSAFAARIEAVRYRAYDLEQRILLRGERAGRLGQVKLYVLITQALCRRDWLATAEAAIDGGADCLQLREKGLEDGELLVRARQFVDLCHRRNVLCFVNDRPDIACLADADGVHLGQTDMSLQDARQIVGADRLIGLSTHNEQQFKAALAVRPDYIAVGPMFDSSTKPQDYVPGPALLSLGTRLTDVPIVPIGGITAENADILKQEGARRICACASVIGADDVAGAARRLVAALAVSAG